MDTGSISGAYRFIGLSGLPEIRVPFWGSLAKGSIARTLLNSKPLKKP